ncbi:putative cytochrome P450 [Mycobacteroides abscessus subsp. abscessus]|nr:putative cytochrome P450 [Mycobacteroides abscessus subsp. abscessus]
MTANMVPPQGCPAHADGPSKSITHARRRPPGPRGMPVLGVVPQIARDPYGSFTKLRDRYGDIVSIPVPGMKLVLLGHPDHVNHVHIKHMDRYTKGDMNAELAGGEVPPLVLREGDDWKRVRRVLNPKFTEQALAGVSEVMFDEITGYIDSWSRYAETDTEVDLDEQFAVITAAALLRAMFSRPTPSGEVDKLQSALNDYANSAAIKIAAHNLPSWIPRPLARKGQRGKDFAMNFIEDFIAERKRHPTGDPDLLNTLMEARFDDGNGNETGFSHAELRIEIAQLLFAGFDTTATALGWTFAFLGLNPAALAKAYEEVDALGGRPITHADIAGMTWLRACFDEAQRLQGAPFQIRMAIVDDEIDGYLIEKGTYVTTSMHILHRDPRWWHEPERYDPNRFLTSDITRNAFTPFSVGPRKCLGMRMAYIEAIAIIAMILQRYTFELKPGFTPRHHMRVSTAVKGGIPVRLRQR